MLPVLQTTVTLPLYDGMMPLLWIIGGLGIILVVKWVIGIIF